MFQFYSPPSPQQVEFETKKSLLTASVADLLAATASQTLTNPADLYHSTAFLNVGGVGGCILYTYKGGLPISNSPSFLLRPHDIFLNYRLYFSLFEFPL